MDAKSLVGMLVQYEKGDEKQKKRQRRTVASFLNFPSGGKWRE